MCPVKTSTAEDEAPAEGEDVSAPAKPVAPAPVDKKDLKGKKIMHIRLDGKSRDFGLIDLNLSAKSSDDEVRAALAKHLRIEIERLALFKIERTKEGNVFVRPDAVFSDR